MKQIEYDHKTDIYILETLIPYHFSVILSYSFYKHVRFIYVFIEHWCWFGGRFLDFYCARIHFPLCCWFLWQWRNCHLLYVADLLPLDKGCQDWSNFLVCYDCFGLFLYGLFMGWLCLSHQFDSFTCSRSYDYRPLLAPNICGL